ncbi:hypothetical protein JY651_36735 [Pyxidicoccus parkwayensis]|uniref:TIGR02270 family protein n=1 Tax=Pyxidicoccus parkwayensis TaxID=2813578 RepID=A0ABX7NXC7_9BACT|nr:hypothetical protein [Pyxidicoccus parkwaysis]QSQ20738.1 hypothetical protein JY651_36735 [Pyxidicoccus parkwaysis]
MRWDVLETHLDEAAFLFTQWDRALESSTRGLHGLEKVEQRLQAHLDALAATGPRGAARLLRPALGRDEPEYVRAACVALLRAGAQAHVDAVLKTFSEGEPASRMEAWRALQLEWRDDAQKQLPRTREADRLEANGMTASEVSLPRGLMRGERLAWRTCQQQADGRDAVGRLARLMLAVGGDDKDLARLTELLQVPELRADVLWALGFSGRPAAAEACVPWMREASLAGLAAEAFCSIVGLKLEGALVGQRVDRDEALVPLEEDLARDLRPKEEDALVLPNPDAVEAWWAKARKDFEPAGRYLAGQSFGPLDLCEALMTLPMRRRPPLALELSIRSQGRCAVEVRAWAHVQREQLRAIQRLDTRLLVQPFAASMRL